LDYVEKLNKVDTSKVKPLAQVTGLDSVTRGDERKKDDKQSTTRDKLLGEAPRKKDNYIQVPKILE
jgi:aspartyl-tRNA(Asn)/glutamyl-tRNA(Gln) amidotransferase subunit C